MKIRRSQRAGATTNKMYYHILSQEFFFPSLTYKQFCNYKFQMHDRCRSYSKGNYKHLIFEVMDEYKDVIYTQLWILSLRDVFCCQDDLIYYNSVTAHICVLGRYRLVETVLFVHNAHLWSVKDVHTIYTYMQSILKKKSFVEVCYG